MPILRAALALLATAFLAAQFAAQERANLDEHGLIEIDTHATIRKSPYMRELWVGFESESVGKADLLRALAAACDDTTSVAVVERTKEATGDAAAPDEVEAIDAAFGRMVLSSVGVKLGLLDPFKGKTVAASNTRVVLVGVLGGCSTVLRIARHKNELANSVVLIDPPVAELPEIVAGASALGVDVLLHPRSDAEFTRETDDVRKRLGPWGKSARVLRGAGPFDGMAERVADAWRQLRAPQLMENGKPSDRALVEVVAAQHGSRVLHVGELHGNPGAHRVELEVLRALIEQGGQLALSTEQFERDVQEKLDKYLAGEITEEAFLKDSRPWPNYADYRPLIELCKGRKIPVIAGNIPRRLASRVNKEGPEVIEKFSDDEKRWTAVKLNANPGAYREKFSKAMGGAEGHNVNIDRLYVAQCIKDDTMAESIAAWLKANPKGRVLHINGAFHSENGLGVPEKLAALVPDIKQAMFTCVETGKELPRAAAGELFVRVPAARPSQ